MRILITSSYSYWGAWSPQDLHDSASLRMIGGGETALLNLSFQLASRGHQVFVFYNTARPCRYRGVDFLPKSYGPELYTTLDHDVLISWEDINPLAQHHRATLAVYAMQNNTMLVGSVDYAIDHYQAVSGWHRDQCIGSDPSFRPISKSKWITVPNGIDRSRYLATPERQPFKIIHSSSPDRGLHHLLAAWSEIKARLPQAELHIFYEMDRLFNLVDSIPDAATKPRIDSIRASLKEHEGNGVFIRGPVNQWVLAQEQLSSALLCYPCDPVQPTEGFGITILEALAAGTPVVTSDADAFPELWTDLVEMIPQRHVSDPERLADAVAGVLLDPEKWRYLSEQGKKVSWDYTWDAVGTGYETWLWKTVKAKKEEAG